MGKTLMHLTTLTPHPDGGTIGELVGDDGRTTAEVWVAGSPTKAQLPREWWMSLEPANLERGETDGAFLYEVSYDYANHFDTHVVTGLRPGVPVDVFVTVTLGAPALQWPENPQVIVLSARSGPFKRDAHYFDVLWRQKNRRLFATYAAPPGEHAGPTRLVGQVRKSQAQAGRVLTLQETVVPVGVSMLLNFGVPHDGKAHHFSPPYGDWMVQVRLRQEGGNVGD